MFLDLFQVKERLWLKNQTFLSTILMEEPVWFFRFFFYQTFLLNVLRHEQMFDRLANLCSV